MDPRRDGGPGAFWQGNGANVLKVMPESAVKFLVYDKAKGFRRVRGLVLEFSAKRLGLLGVWV